MRIGKFAVPRMRERSFIEDADAADAAHIPWQVTRAMATTKGFTVWKPMMYYPSR
jgi:hypothetical protein